MNCVLVVRCKINNIIPTCYKLVVVLGLQNNTTHSTSRYESREKDEENYPLQAHRPHNPRGLPMKRRVREVDFFRVGAKKEAEGKKITQK